jgi:hypothetical protein
MLVSRTKLQHGVLTHRFTIWHLIASKDAACIVCYISSAVLI